MTVTYPWRFPDEYGLNFLVFVEICDGLQIFNDECRLDLNFVVNSVTDKTDKTCND